MNADVIVVGVGGMGSAACHALARAGARVIGIERFTLGHALGSSHGESRLIRKSYYEHPDYVPLLQRSYELWKELESEQKTRLYQETGLIYLGPSNGTLVSGVLRSARVHSLDVRALRGAERKALSKWFHEERFEEVLYEPEAGFLHVEACVLAQIRQAKRYGARILESETLLSWSADKGGVQVRTNQGHYRAEKLVFTAGPWMPELLGELGLPLRVVRKVLCWIPAPENFSLAQGAPCYLCEAPEGLFYGFPEIGGENAGLMKLAEHTGGDPAPDPLQLERGLGKEEARRILSFTQMALRDAGNTVARHVACMYTVTPDENFILDLHPKHSNVVIASCCSGHGFKFAPVIGEVLKDLALEGRTALPIGFLGLSPAPGCSNTPRAHTQGVGDRSG